MNVLSQSLTPGDILAMLKDPEDVREEDDHILKNDDFLTPAHKNDNHSEILQPSNFYGGSVNVPNSLKFKNVSGQPVSSKVKTRLFVDLRTKPGLKRRLEYFDGNKVKRRKEVFTGVRHSLKPEKRKRPLLDMDDTDYLAKSVQAEVNRTKAKRSTSKKDLEDAFDISRIPISKKKNKSPLHVALKFRKPERLYLDDESTLSRKIFKSTISSPARVYFEQNIFSNGGSARKRKLLNPSDVFSIDENETKSASDLFDLIENGKVVESEENEVTENIDKVILQLEDNATKCGSESSDIINSFTENELDLSNLSLSDFSDSKKRILQDWNCSPVKRNSPAKRDEVLTPTKKKLNSPLKENVETTPQQKLFPVFEKRNFMSMNCSDEKKPRTYSSGKKWHALGNSQYQIDAGQKRFGATQCSTCGVVYQLGDPDDEMDHEKYHRNFKIFKHSGWANENVVGLYGLDRIIVVTTENKSWWNKASNVLKVVDEELGYTTEERVSTGLKVYLYIHNKQITGCLVAARISRANRIITDGSGIDLMSDDSYPVKCGISRLWTHSLHRRKGIASRLVNAMRCSFFFSYYVKVDEFAFSAPTEDGKAFAARYTKKRNFLIYTGW